MGRFSLTIELRNGNDSFWGAANFSAPNVPDEVNIDYDATGALYYVTAVIIFYGLSMILLIASLSAKQGKDKLCEFDETQLNRYLNKANIIKERGVRDSIKEVKKSIISVVNHGTEVPGSGSWDDIATATTSHNVSHPNIREPCPDMYGTRDSFSKTSRSDYVTKPNIFPHHMSGSNMNEIPNVQSRSSILQNRRKSCPAATHPTIPEEESDCSLQSADQWRSEREQMVSIQVQSDRERAERIPVHHGTVTYQSYSDPQQGRHYPDNTLSELVNTSTSNTFNCGATRQITNTCCCKVNHGQSVSMPVATSYRKSRKNAIPITMEEELIHVTCV